MASAQLTWILFPIAITLHNLEEAIWLPGWSRQAGKFHKVVEPGQFRFAVVVVTVIAYLSTFLAIAFPSPWLWKQIFFGFLGAMIVNAFVPHLLATIALRKYAPGVLSGVLLLVPINVSILSRALAEASTQPVELVVWTVLVGGILLALLRPLFWLGGRLFP